MQTDSSFTFVLFGGTGDLSMRKILPALYEAHRAGMLARALTQCPLTCRGRLPIRENAHLASQRTLFSSN